MGLTRKKNKFLTSLTQNVGYKNKSKKKNKEGMVGGVVDSEKLEKAKKKLQLRWNDVRKKKSDALNQAWLLNSKGNKQVALQHFQKMKMYKEMLLRIKNKYDDITKLQAQAAQAALLQGAAQLAVEPLTPDEEEELRELEKLMAEGNAEQAGPLLPTELQTEFNEDEMRKEFEDLEAAQPTTDEEYNELLAKSDAAVAQPAVAGAPLPAGPPQTAVAGAALAAALAAALPTVPAPKALIVAGRRNLAATVDVLGRGPVPTGIINEITTIEASIANTKQALLNSIYLCIAVQKSIDKDENVIDKKIFKAINDTINSENYNFSENTLAKAIETLGSITLGTYTYERNKRDKSFMEGVTDNLIKSRKKAAIDAVSKAIEAIEAIDDITILQGLINSIGEILPHTNIDIKNYNSIIAIFTILAAKDCVKFASSTSLTIPALNSFMAALNAFEASLELEDISEKLEKMPVKDMKGGGKALIEEDDKAPPSETDKIALQIAKVKAANNLALKAEDYFYTCMDLEEEAAKSGTKDIKQKANSERILAENYYLTAKDMAKNVTKAVLDNNDVNPEDLGILTPDIIKDQTNNRKNIDQYVKKIMNGLSSIEDKTRVLMDKLNELLESKRDIYNPPNIEATVVNAKATEEQAHIASINKIMNYLNEKNIDLKYYWAEIVTSKYDKEKLHGKVGKVGIINEITENTENADVKGLWNVKLWIPDTKGEYIRSPHGAVSKYMKVITKDNKTIDTFIQQNSVSIYSVRFLKDIKYDPNLPNNRQPDVTNANTRTLGRLTSDDRKYLSRVNAITNVSGSTRDIIDNAADFSSRLNKRTLGIGEFKSKYKNEIAKILDHEITDASKRNLLKQVIVYDNKKLSIRDILASNISSIFAKGETSLNVYRQQNLRKNFKKEAEEPKEPEEAEEGEEGGEEEEGDEEEGREKGKNQSGGGEEQIGGLGSYGFRNFDREDARDFIDFILESLVVLKTELKIFDKDQEDKLDKLDKLTNTQALLIEKYLISLFEQIGPSGLNKLLPQISNTKTVSKLVIKHFIERLKRRQEDKEGKEGKEGEEGATPAKQISKLNFSLKHNAGSFASAIIDITLNSEELQGTEDEIENDLNKKYDKAMKIPFEAEKSRIANSQIRQVFIEVFGEKLTTINEYRKRIKEIDDLIDTITNTNIKQKLKNINGILTFATITNDVITYRLPNNLKDALKSAPTTETTEEKLAKAMELIKDLKYSTTDHDKLTKLKRLDEKTLTFN